jgi:penicillin-binding protein 1A
VVEPRSAWLTSKLLREIVTNGHSAPIRAIKLPTAGKTGTSSRTSDVWFIGYTSRWMATAWIGDDKYERQLGYKDASFMLTVPMWARFIYAANGEMPLDEIPWEKPPKLKASDIGGPLKPGRPTPPQAGFGIDGKPLNLPTKQDGQPVKIGAPPPTLVKPKVIRVQSAQPKIPVNTQEQNRR